MNFRYRLLQFMSGRYGFDTLSGVVIAISVVLSVINTFVRNIYLQLAVYALIIYAFYRMLSRNTSARAKENRWFVSKLNWFKGKSELYKTRKNDAYHIYRRCPSCKAILKLPRRVGTHKTVCPRCSYEFKVKVRK